MDDRPQHFYCGISGTVCTVRWSIVRLSVDSIANAKVSILVRPMSVVKRSRYYGGSQFYSCKNVVRSSKIRIILRILIRS
jgi:hypothetical protein